MTDVDVLRVFTDERGRHGNPLGVVRDAAGLSREDRQSVATRLGYSETIFFDDLDSARLEMYTPACELPFAGHPLVGASWLLARQAGRQPGVLRPARLPSPVRTFADGGAVWIRGNVSDTPPWEHVQLASPAEVEAQAPPAGGRKWRKTQIWAWDDERAGIVRARVFALDYDVVEDEACGSATLRLAFRLGRPIVVRHGLGSVIRARPAGPGAAEVGGRVAYETRLVIDPPYRSAGAPMVP